MPAKGLGDAAPMTAVPFRPGAALMDRHSAALLDVSGDAAYDILHPHTRTLPLVLASPHSGNRYPDDFLAASRLDRRALRKSEDCFVDEIFAGGPRLGVPLLRALFPRAYLDLNREPFELDPAMFADPLPAHVNSLSPRVAAGLGTIARVVSSGEDIYKGKLRLADALARIERLYRPYHAALRALVEETRTRFGFCILLDCHSMPSLNGPPHHGGGAGPEFVLGDCYGSACAPWIVEAAQTHLAALGYTVCRNTPYAGGYTTRHYGRPRLGVHALQIEINRALYMDEGTLTPLPHLRVLAGQMDGLILALGRCPPA